jgi:tRNA threonylcarbamoyl adenosine modification protein YeaZ
VLLTLDTATPLVTVALADDERVLAQATSEVAMRHGEQLAPLIDLVLRRADATRADLTAVGVGVGPGPFTGLRVGLVTARTLGFVLEIPVYGVCSLDVIAAEAAGHQGPEGRLDGPFLVATDARRKEVYLASYDAVDGVASRVEGPVVTRPAGVATDLPVAGAGPGLYPEAFPHPLSPDRPSAAWLARVIAQESAELLDPEPLYLRRPDAEAPGKPKPVS